MIPLNELFDIQYGHSLELNRLTLLAREQGGIPFVSRKAGNNGIAAYVAPIPGVEPALAGVLTCALGGSVLATFLQEEPFYSGRDMAHLRPKVPMTKQQLLFYCYCLQANRYRYSYGRQANKTLKGILVPGLDSLPDWVALTDISRFDGVNASANERAANNCSTVMELKPETWAEFRLGDLFDIQKGQRLTKADMTAGDTPHIGASDASNGETARIGQQAIHKGGTISVSYDGSIAEAFYLAMFVCTVIRMEKHRFNYGRKWYLERMLSAVIKLPVTTDGQPDWAYMENYIKSLPYSSVIA